MPAPTILCRPADAAESAAEYVLGPDAAVIFMDDGTARLLDMDGRFYAVPPVGAMMLQQTLQRGAAAAAEQVAAAFGADRRVVEADLQRFLAPLEQRGILERRGKGRCRKSRVSLLPAILLKMIVAILPRGKARIAALLALARISFHLSGWPATVAAWKRQFPVRNHGHAFDQESARAIDEAVCTAAAHSPLGVNCKERALCCWALAREAGCPAELVIGVELFPLSGHCWCEAGPWVVSDHADKCARYIPALRYA